MQSDLDANHYRIVNLDTSNLPPSGQPPTIVCPAHNWLNGYDAMAMAWSYARPNFTDIAGVLTRAQQAGISEVGTIRAGFWNAAIIQPTYLPTLDRIRAPEANVSMAGYRLTDVAMPVNPTDAVNLQYMDNLLQGLNVKEAVKCATTGHSELVGLRAIDGVTIAAGDRIGVIHQTTLREYENGIYIAAVNAWTRSTDCDSAAEIDRAYFTVLEGTVNGGSSFVNTSALLGHWPPVAGDIFNFVLFSHGLSIVAGNGLQLVGNTLNAIGTANRISIGAAIDIANTYAGQNSINTLGTITIGTWEGNVITSQFGGTGVNNDPWSISLATDFAVAVQVGAINPFLILSVTGATNVTLPVTGTLATVSGAETLTNKRITKRTQKIASNDQPTINTNNLDSFYITALAVDITSMTANLSGTPTDSEEFIIWIKDNGLSRAITWGAKFTASADLPLPTATSAGYWLFLKFHYSTELSQWVLTTKLNHI